MSEDSLANQRPQSSAGAAQPSSSVGAAAVAEGADAVEPWAPVFASAGAALRDSRGSRAV